ncbi:MAG: nucleotidyltransferase family protein [Atribacterota bacterium]
MLNALILAGTKGRGPLEIATNVENKTLIMINGRPIIDYIVDALKRSKNIDKIVVVGPKNELYYYIGEKVEKIIEPGNSILYNLEVGIKYFNSNKDLLILTSDIPLISPQAIDEFIEKCLERKAHLGYPIIKKENIIKKYPEAQRTYVKIKEGTVCGGNIIFFKPEIFYENKELIQELFENRKAMWKWAKILGLKFVIKYLLKTITLKEIEEKVTGLVGYKSAAIIISYPELMIDLDKISDYELVQKYLKK